MQPQDFITKWRAVELKERSASQSHFNDLCAVLGTQDPISADPKGEWFTFEKGASKTAAATAGRTFGSGVALLGVRASTRTSRPR